MVKRKTSKSKHRKASYRQIKGVGRRCVEILASGKWRFRKASACGAKTSKRKTHRKRK